MQKKHWIKLVCFLVLAAIIAAGALYYLPLTIFSTQQKPEQVPQKLYDHYIVLDEDTNEVLMYVPLVVSVGDEVISEKNKRYKIIKVEENHAYARFVEDLNLELYQK